MQTTQRLKSELWKRYGSEQHPAEWDGRLYGGGKLSQRYWEYFKAIELLELTPESVVLDIGGGSPTSGAGFFAALLAGAVRRVMILDPEVPAAIDTGPNITLIRETASREGLIRLLRTHPEVTHIASISVFEHVEHAVREGVVQAINEAPTVQVFVSTFEYHPRRVYFDHQLTARSVSALFSHLTNYYLEEFESSPVWCENAFDRKRILRLGRNRPYTAPNFSPANIPLWHPVAVKFVRQPGAADQRRPSPP